MLTDWESWTEPVFNAIRLQKETKLEITLKWDIAEQPRKAPMTEHCLKEKKKKKKAAILIKPMKENTKLNRWKRLVTPRELLIPQFVTNEHELYVSVVPDNNPYF